MSQSLDKLVPELKQKAQQFLQKCKEAGLNVQIYYTFRTKEEQQALYMQGRDTLENVNKARKQAGLAPISQSENKIVTQTKDSAHMYGVAFDFAPVKDGKFQWNDTQQFTKAGKIAESLGLVWGGSWTSFKDMPHVELPNWQKKYKK